jgi:hypothetical protein
MPMSYLRLFPTVVTGLLALSACSGSPPSKEPVAQAPTPAASAPVSPQPGSSDPQKLTPERILQLQREGYKLVDRDGQTYYCRTEAKTGSRLARDTVCMTEAEMTTLRDRTKQGLGRVMREQAPPQGN